MHTSESLAVSSVIREWRRRETESFCQCLRMQFVPVQSNNLVKKYVYVFVPGVDNTCSQLEFVLGGLRVQFQYVG